MSAFVINPYAFGFKPTDISGCALWVDANVGLFDATSGGNAVTADSGSVARWEDQSGNGRHATQSVSANRPILKTNIKNGLSVVRYDGSNDELSFSSVVTTDATPIWVFVVNYFDTTSLFRNAVNVNQFAYFYFASSTQIGIGRQGATDEALRNHSAATWAVIGGYAEKVGSTTQTKLRINKGETTKSANTSGGTVLNLVGEGGVNSFDGDLAEVIIYNSNLSPSDVTRVEDYLNAKWNVF